MHIHTLSLIQKQFYSHSIHFILFFCLLIPGNINAENKLDRTVIVSSKASDIITISRRELRKIYLGRKPSTHSKIHKVIINHSDKKTYHLFLKNIMFMTDAGYKRKLLKRVFRQGSDQLLQFETTSTLKDHLLSNPNDISFMSESDAINHTDLQIIRVR